MVTWHSSGGVWCGKEARSWASWAEGCSQPQGPCLLPGTSPGLRDLSSSPRSASSCSVTVSQSPLPLGLSLLICTVRGWALIQTHKDWNSFCSHQGRVSTVSHTGPAHRGFPLRQETGNAQRGEEKPGEDRGRRGEGACGWARGWRKS